MVPRIASRGHSFQGAGNYYLHDKGADTSERVAWTETYNLPTNNADKAMGWMAYTAMSADNLKRSSGIKATGRKAQKGCVYSYSLAWHPDQSPQEDHMKEQARTTLELLGLQDHEAVVVAHQETDHDHIHVIVNLIHPETGKTAKVYKDHLVLSEWAEAYEKDRGKIYCEKRVENNQERKIDSNKDKIIKHKEDKVARAEKVQELYSSFDNGVEFKDALEKEGYVLAKGDRRGYVLVDQNGDIHSLSRQLKGQRAKDIKERLSTLEDLRLAKEVSEELKHFDRDAYHQNWQKKVEDASIEGAQQKEEQERGQKQMSTQETRVDKKIDLVKQDVLQLYQLSDNGKSFKSALNSEGYVLAKGDKSTLVIVSQDGSIYNLNQVLSDVNQEDLDHRVSSIDVANLPDAQNVDQRQENRKAESTQVQPEAPIKKDEDEEKSSARGYADHSHYLNVAELLIGKVINEKMGEYGRSQTNDLNSLKSKYIAEEKLREQQSRLKEISNEIGHTKGIFKKSKLQRLNTEREALEQSIALSKARIQTELSNHKLRQEEERKNYKESLLMKYSKEEKAEELKRLDDQELERNKQVQERKIREYEQKRDRGIDPPEPH